MTVTRSEAADALAGMHDARLRANAMKRLPFAYHLAFGLLMGGWVYVQNLSHRELQIGVLLLIALGAAMYRWQRRATGRFVNGWRRGRTFVVALAIFGIMLVLLATSSPARFPDYRIFQPWQGAVIAFVLAAFLDWLWVKAYDADVQAGR
jgi:hypothetical protein